MPLYITGTTLTSNGIPLPNNEAYVIFDYNTRYKQGSKIILQPWSWMNKSDMESGASTIKLDGIESQYDIMLSGAPTSNSGVTISDQLSLWVNQEVKNIIDSNTGLTWFVSIVDINTA